MFGRWGSVLPEPTQNARGHLVLVVGPSGAGKDTLIDAAKVHFAHIARLHFVRRIVTRATSQWEDHDSVSEADFITLLGSGAFCLHWHAHGLSYGIPKTVETWLAQGDTVVFNCSRNVISQAKAQFPDVKVIRITASPSTLAARLKGRARDGDVQSRLERPAHVGADVKIDGTVVNDGDLSEAIAQFTQLLERLLQQTDAACA